MSDARFCLALDVPDVSRATDWVVRTGNVIGVYKIGLQLFCAEGPQIVDAIRKAGAKEIFLDLKLHDIPRTVAGAVERLARLGVDYLTVHTGGGADMLRAASEASGQMRLLGVTVLTSMDRHDLSAVGIEQSIPETVSARAQLAISSGIQGIVSSAQEAGELRETLGPGPMLVTPGIRLAGQDVGDQKRVFTPQRALDAGASMLVLGRAITQAEDVSGVLKHLSGMGRHG